MEQIATNPAARRKRRQTLLHAVSVVLILAVLPPLEAEEVPDFEFQATDGSHHRIADYRGKPLLLDFWASWCFPCRKSFPELDRLRRDFGDKGLAVVAITMEVDDAAVEEFLRRFPTKVTVGREPSGRAGKLLGIKAMPTTFLVAADGTIAGRFEGGGEATPEAIRKGVDRLIAGQAVTSGRPDRRHAGRGKVKAWERGYLADPIMNLDGNPVLASIREHIHSSKEGAAGRGGVAGGGCGCN